LIKYKLQNRVKTSKW